MKGRIHITAVCGLAAILTAAAGAQSLKPATTRAVVKNQTQTAQSHEAANTTAAINAAVASSRTVASAANAVTSAPADASKASVVDARANWSRDPFQSPLPPMAGVLAGKPAPVVRPSGVSGVLLEEVRVQGVVLGGVSGPLSLVTGPQGHTYFLRPGSRIFDARVIAVEGNGVWFERTLAGNIAGSQSGDKGASGDKVFLKVN